MTELRPLWQDTDCFELRKLHEAWQLVNKSELTAEEVAAMYEKAEYFRKYLNAEKSWKIDNERRIAAEKERVAREELLRDNAEAYAAAERGWLALKDIVPNLDGAPSFGRLPAVLQDRYAIFAKKVLS